MPKKQQTKKASPKNKTTKPKSKKDDLVVVHNPVNPTQEFIVASEFADDEAIEAELMGKAMEHYVYSFNQGGQNVTGLTVSGVNEMSRQLTKNPKSGIKIRISPENVKVETDVQMGGVSGVRVVVIAENLITGETGIGAKFEPYKKIGRRGEYDNTFALEKAVSKAERNAKRKLIPEKVAIEMIKRFFGKEENVKKLEMPQNSNLTNEVRYEPIKEEVNYSSKFLTILAREAGVIINKNITKAQGEKMVNYFNEKIKPKEKLTTLALNNKEAEKRLNELLVL